MSCSCHQTGGYCQCLVQDSSCVIVVGSNPYELEFVVDEDPNNIVESTPLGLQVVLPNDFTNPESTGVYNTTDQYIPVAYNVPQAIPFDVSLWDTHGGFNEARSVRRLYFADDGVYFSHANSGWFMRAAATTLRSGPRFSVNTNWWKQSANRTVGGATASEPTFLNSAGIESVTAGSYVELMVQSTISVADLLSEASPRRASLSLVRLGSL